MAQSGLLLPAKEVRLGCFTQVWADIGDEQSLQQSLSTFSGHIKNISEALRAVKPGALVLLDEIGAGTDPAEGAALAKAILLNLQKRGARVLASTHYGELKLFAYNAKGFRNAAMEFDLKTLRPTYHLLLDAAGASHGLRIAERYGIPKAVVEEARSYLSGEEQEVARVLASLEQSQRLARRAQSEADRLAARLREVEKEAEKKILQAEEAQRQARTKSKEVLEKLLRELRLESAEVFESLKKNPSSQGIEVSRKKLKEIQERGEEALRSFAEPAPEGSSETQIEPGMLVRVVGYPQNGTVLSLKNDAALVQIGAVKMVVDLNKLVPVTQETAPPKRALSETHRLAMEKSQTLSSEIHLRQLRVEEAREVLEKFLDDAVLAGLSSVRIVHGKGSGVLRNMVRECLNRHHGVKNYRLGATFEGGSGVTVVELK
jgi:DNA mismatch repair protein MutS2